VLLDKSIRIHAPADRVFAWLQPARQPLWDRSVLRASPRGDGPLHEGALVDRVTRALGLRLESAAETVALEAGRLFAWRQVEGDYEQHRGAFLLEAEGEDETRVRLLADVDLPYVLPRLVTEAEVQDALSRDADEALFNLKALVERGAAS
jgi:uncharacterized membrane protein